MSVSYNKMSAIKVAGTYVNNVPSGTSLGNVSLDVTGKSHFTSDMLIDGSFNILNINSSDPTGIFNIANNHTTGNINIGTWLTTGAINISNTTTLNAPITIGSTLSTTQTATHNAITSFSKIPSCNVAPTTSYHLCNKTYVDSNFVDKTTTQTITGNKTYTGSADFLSLTSSTIDITGSISTPAVNSNLQTDNLLVGQNQTSGKLFLGCRTDRTEAINIGTLATGNAPINIGSTASTTQTATHNAITTFSKIPSCSVAPTTSDHLTNKTYVDSISGSSLLTSKNAWSKENDFANIIRVQTPAIDPYTELDLYSADYNSITINGAPGTTFALPNVNLNTNTLSVPIGNNQSLIKVKIPINIAGYGAPIIYIGQLDVIFNGITSITILKNGSLHKNVTIYNLVNFTGTTKTWTGWSQKQKNGRAYLGNVEFEIPLSTGNTSVDTYTIGMAIDVAVNAAASLYVGPYFLCQGDANFTTTHAQTDTGATYTSTDPANFFGYQITFGNIGSYIIGTDSIYMRAGSFIQLNSTAGVDLKTKGGTINLLASEEGGAGDINIKTLGTGATNIKGNVSITGAITIGDATIGGATIQTSGSNTSITAPTNMSVYGTTLSTLGYNGGSNTTLIDGFTIQMRSPVSPIYTGTPHGAQVGLIGCRVVVPFTSSTSSAVTTVYTQNNFPIGVWIVEIKTTFSYAAQPPASAWYRIGTSGVSGSFNDTTRVCDFNPNSSGSQNCHFTTTYQFSGSQPLYVIQQHSGTTITTPTNGSYVSYTRIA